MFFLDSKGSFNRVDDVVRFVSTYEGTGGAKVYMKDGTTLTVPRSGLDAISRSGWSTVPAAPGTLQLGLVEDHQFFVEPVVAWMIGPTDAPVPITPSGPEGGVVNDYVIALPNGSIISPRDRSWPTLAAYMIDQQFTDDEQSEALAMLADFGFPAIQRELKAMEHQV